MAKPQPAQDNTWNSYEPDKIRIEDDRRLYNDFYRFKQLDVILIK